MSERIGVYRVQAAIGKGGMAEVFLAWDDRLERRVAIKRIRRDAGLSEEQRERFRREARVVAGLSHPAIVQIFDVVSGPSGDAIVMEYVHGRTLAERLASGPLDIEEILRLGRQIAEGLAAAHSAGLIHRDLKSDNVIVTPGGLAKILDFGLARPLVRKRGEKTLTREGALIGTCHAMSPEQARGEAVDKRSDLFSFGSLLYEMLTRRPPFRGPNPIESLRRVIQEDPPPVGAVRPEVPYDLEALVGRLLAKDREARPSSAREVAQELERIEDAARTAAEPGSGSVSDMPTKSLPAWTAPVETGARRAAPAAGRALDRGRRRLALAAALTAVAAAAGIGLYLAGRPPEEPLRIAVARPAVVPPGDERLRLVASGLMVATLGGLASLEGLAPVDPEQVGRGASPPMEMARATAADEVLTATVERQGRMSRVSLRRIRGSDGTVLWTDAFDVPADPEGLRLLSDVLGVRLRRAYPDHRPRAGTPEIDVRDEDYAAFLQVEQRIDSGQASLEPELERLEAIARRSPRFLEAQLLAARIALSLFRSTREPAYLDRAQGFLRAAQELAPSDPRPLVEAFQAALAAGRQQEAESVLERLDPLLPGDPEALALRARLAESQGRTEEALSHLRKAARIAPSWQNLYRLADLEARTGRIAGAREHFAQIERDGPGNRWGLERLAYLELFYGDVARAERIYQDLLRTSPQRHYYTNLGLAHYLRGRHAEAIAAYGEALKLAPDHVTVLLNLADAESALGRARDAEAHYLRVLERLGEQEAAAGLQSREVMMRAQCLARLGRSREAVEAAQTALRQSPDDPEVVFSAAVVYALTGDRASALVNAEAALAKGIQPRWLTISAFDPLRDDPEMRALLDRSR